ncbi:Nn.00g079520.m01.CDS01 [Neocucurbitaria sp. VM-36]
MSTTNITFSALPLELVQQIADCVEKVHRPSLFAFSLASKACHSAAAFLVVKKICITIHGCDKLQRDADRLVEALARADSARYVQSITINGALHLSGKRTAMYNTDDCWFRRCGLAEILVDEEQMDFFRKYVVYDEGVIEKSSEEDMAWAPVVNLLQAIPNLKDLIYDCQTQFPPSLLRTLHEQQPQCRLHHLTFRFRTLLWGVPYPYEMELATSLSLYRVEATCSYQDSDGDFDFNLDAVMELAAGLAPNLKEVTILGLYPVLPSSQRSVRKPLWQGLPGSTGAGIGSLTSLSLRGYPGFTSPAQLQNWAKHTDFDNLQHLFLGGSYLEKSCGLSGETMEWIARNHSFPRLKTLEVYLNRDDSHNERPHYSENAISFFQAIDSLEELSINGPMEPQIVDAILIHHGPTLKKLSLNPFEDMQVWSDGRDRREIPMEFTKDRILHIQAQCPVLEELAIPVMRNKSSTSETKIYKCFRKMKNLRSLFLTLDCANWRIRRDPTYDAQFEGKDQELAWSFINNVKRGNVREALINSAVDESLARSIWEMITQNKTGRRLERLKLWTKNGGFFASTAPIYAVPTATQSMSRSWLIERLPRNDKEDVTCPKCQAKFVSGTTETTTNKGYSLLRGVDYLDVEADPIQYRDSEDFLGEGAEQADQDEHPEKGDNSKNIMEV